MTSVRWVSIVLGALLAGIVLFALAGAAAAQDNETCLGCHTAPGMVLTFPSTEVVSVTVDAKRFGGSAHGQALTCAACHPRNVEVPHPKITARTFTEYRRGASGVCATCHEGSVTAFAASVHGRAQQMGFAEAPTCVTCHNPHDAARVKTPAFRNNLPQLCGTCHADPALMQKYGLRPVYQTYISEFHGVTTSLYKLTKPQDPTPAAMCTDCHGGHEIRAGTDPASSVHPARLLTTCRTCHPAAGRLFTTAWTEHKIPGPDAAPLVWYVQLFYGFLIPVTVAFVGVLTVLDLGRWATDQLRRGGKP